MEFTDIIGNEKNKELLKSILKQQKLSHSYMFIGKEGIGKFLFANKWAKMILCQAKEELECNKCKSCVQFDSNNHPDFYVIDQDETIKIEQIRNLQAKILEKPIISNKKVYIINNADTMTKEAQNCLLKTLEEPPEYVVIILIGANENIFLNTIRSRCTKISFEPLKEKELIKILKEKFNIYLDPEYLIKVAQGSVKTALSIAQKKDLYKSVQDVFENTDKYTLLDVLNKLQVLYKNKEDIQEILDYIEYIFLNKAQKETKYLRNIEEIEKTKKNIISNSNYDMQIDYLLFKIWEENAF